MAKLCLEPRQIQERRSHSQSLEQSTGLDESTEPLCASVTMLDMSAVDETVVGNMNIAFDGFWPETGKCGACEAVKINDQRRL